MQLLRFEKIFFKIFDANRSSLLYNYELTFKQGNSPNLNITKHLPLSGILNDEKDSVVIREIIKAAKKSITIVDPYLNSSSTLKEIIKDINPAIELLLLTDSKNKKNFEIGLTIADNLNIKYMTPSQEKKFHDRFLIIDNSEYYHFGSSLNGITVSKVSSFRKIIGLNKIHELRNKLKEILAIS